MINEGGLKEWYSKWSTEDLERALTTERKSYTNIAISVIEAELSKRNIGDRSKSKSLKVNKKIVEESICRICTDKFSLGEDIKQCENCLNFFHNKCWEEYKGCNQSGCVRDTKTCPACGNQIRKTALKCRHCGQYVDTDLKHIDNENKILKETSQELKKEIRSWGIGLVVLGIVHIFLAGFLDPLWGVIIIVLGVVNLLVIHRSMFIVNGLALIFIGLMNINATGGWQAFGILQLIWGGQEIKKFGKYKLS